MSELDDLRHVMTTTMNQIGRYWRRLTLSIASEHGISAAASFPLMTMSRMGQGVRQGTLAEAVGLEGPSLVRLLDQLCAGGLVERREDPLDRRAKTLFLTPEGQRITARIEEQLVELRHQVLGGVSREDLEATLRVFRVIEDAAGRAELSGKANGAGS